MTKKELINIVYKKNDELTKKQIAKIINLSFLEMEKALLKNDKVRISGIGTIKIIEKRRKKFIIPKTKKIIYKDKSKKTVVLKPSEKLLNKIN